MCGCRATVILGRDAGGWAGTASSPRFQAKARRDRKRGDGASNRGTTQASWSYVRPGSSLFPARDCGSRISGGTESGQGDLRIGARVAVSSPVWNRAAACGRVTRRRHSSWLHRLHQHNPGPASPEWLPQGFGEGTNTRRCAWHLRTSVHASCFYTQRERLREERCRCQGQQAARDVGVLSSQHARLCSLTARGTPKAGMQVLGSDRIREGSSSAPGGLLGTRSGELCVLFWLL